jgi:hypothetical protein
MASEHFEYIKSRMKELGNIRFHSEILVEKILSGETLKQIKAYNEYLYLVSDSVPNGVIIHSDTFILKGSPLSSFPHIPYEFTGHVIITSGNIPDFSLQFIRVTPE